jgi:MATE family multidrug resistance protein
MQSFRQCWRLAWPLILSNLSVPLLGMVDTAVVGHLPQAHHLAAVALGATVLSVLYFLFGFLRMGTTGLTAQALGAGDQVEVRATLVRGLLVAMVLGLLLLVSVPLTIGAARTLLAPTPAAEPGLAAYIAVRLCSAPAALGTFVLLGWFLGLQDARRPLALMVLTNILNAGASPSSSSSGSRWRRPAWRWPPPWPNGPASGSGWPWSAGIGGVWAGCRNGRRSWSAPGSAASFW